MAPHATRGHFGGRTTRTGIDLRRSQGVARIVEVPGALSQGKTREEVRENVLDALQVVLAPDDDDASVQAGRGEPLDLTVTR